jgi:hypothetical protein
MIARNLGSCVFVAVLFAGHSSLAQGQVSGPGSQSFRTPLSSVQPNGGRPTLSIQGPVGACYSGPVNGTGPNSSCGPLAIPIGTDCNGNGVDDGVDILYGTSSDHNCDCIPDECCPNGLCPGGDCDRNGFYDDQEICDQPSLDCNDNGVLDACENVSCPPYRPVPTPTLDCQGQGVVKATSLNALRFRIANAQAQQVVGVLARVLPAQSGSPAAENELFSGGTWERLGVRGTGWVGIVEVPVDSSTWSGERVQFLYLARDPGGAVKVRPLVVVPFE